MIGGIQNDFSGFMAQLVRQRSAADALTRLATGLAINRASDGPAALIAGIEFDSTLAEIDAQSQINVRASNQAMVADAGLDSISSLLDDAKSLAVANSGSTLSDAEKQGNQVELDAIVNTVDRLSSATRFNGQPLLDGSGSISSADDSISIDNASSEHIGSVTINGKTYTLSDVASGKDLNITGGNVAGASSAIDQAIDDISTMRGEIGAFAQGASSSQGSLLRKRIATVSSLSMIRDTDYAMEASRRIREQILAAAGNFALGFAGATPGGILSLFA